MSIIIIADADVAAFSVFRILHFLLHFSFFGNYSQDISSEWELNNWKACLIESTLIKITGRENKQRIGWGNSSQRLTTAVDSVCIVHSLRQNPVFLRPFYSSISLSLLHILISLSSLVLFLSFFYAIVVLFFIYPSIVLFFRCNHLE